MHDVMTDDEVDAQLERYKGHHFCTIQGKNICIDERLDLAAALARHRAVKVDLETANRIGHFVRSYEENNQLLKDLREQEEVERAQVMAAFFRVADCWPKDAKEALGL
jgi:hypothetical protein